MEQQQQSTFLEEHGCNTQLLDIIVNKATINHNGGWHCFAILGPCNRAIELQILSLVLPVAACSFLSSPVIIVVFLMHYAL
jgi:hypothetical protein